MKFGTRGLMAALEDDNAEVGTGEGDVVPEVVADIEPAHAEVAEDAAEIEGLNAVVEDAAQEAEVLGDIQETMEDKLEEGETISPEAAEIAEIAVERIFDRLEIKRNVSVIPAMENFKSKNAGNAALRHAVEGLTDQLKVIWQKIVKVLKAIWQKITDFFAKFFSNAEKMKAAAKKIQEQASSAKGKKDQEKLKLGAVGKAFSDGKNFVKPEEILETHAALTQGYVAAADILNNVAGSIEGFLKKPEEFDAIRDKFLGDLEKGIDTITKTPKTSKETEKDGDANVKVAKVGPLVGGQYLTLKLKEPSGDAAASLSADLGGSGGGVAEVPALSAQEAGSLAGEVVKLMDITIDYKKKQAKIEAVQKSLIRVAEAAVNLMGSIGDSGEEAGKTKASVAQARSTVTQLATAANRMTTMLPAFNVRAGKFALNYASASLKNLKAEESTKE